MAEFKAAFEKDNPDITLTLVDSPFAGFHDKAVMLFQAKKLADVLMVQVDWVAEFADLGMLEPLDDWIAKEPKAFMDNIPAPSTRSGRGSSTTCRIESGCRGAVLQHRALQERRDRRAAEDLGRIRGGRQEGDEPRKEDLRHNGDLAVEPPTNMTYDIYPLILQAGGDI